MPVAAVRASPGLSPLARGTLPVAAYHAQSARFIPAGAGNTKCRTLRASLSAVYPRWRGEHSQINVANHLTTGLSPLARGTHLLRSGLPYRHRFIPAGAGNTCRRSRDGSGGTVYPRWRGEHATATSPPNPMNGLSPLARGTLRQPHRRPH